MGIGWWEAYHCQICGNTIEADGSNDIPENYRQMLLDKEGIWTARISADGHLDIHILKAVRSVLGLTLAQTAELTKSGNSRLASGTLAEMEQIKLDLANKGIEVRVSKEERA
jgi:ribosomal protein L7/L12